MAEDTVQPGYLVSFSKQTSQMGEVIQISTNLPVGATKEQLGEELVKIAWALGQRLKEVNKEVLAQTGKTLKEIGVDIPGFNQHIEE